MSLLELLPEAEMYNDFGLTWLITDIQFPLFNSVFRTNISDNESRLKQWCLVTTQVFEFPDSIYGPWYDVNRSISKISNSPCKNYIGILVGEVVAASSVFYGAGVAEIFNIATIESARKKGIGLAIRNTVTIAEGMSWDTLTRISGDGTTLEVQSGTESINPDGPQYSIYYRE